MFYDERIEKAKGSISRNAIIISVIISAIIGAIRLANVLKNTAGNKYLCLIVLETVIVLGGSVCLLIGSVRSKLHIKDERTVYEESLFYNKASAVLIKTVTIVFAVFLPIVLYIGHPNNFADAGFDSVFPVLFFIVGIYVIYCFRRNDIYFNYSIMENEHYYKCVFRNIGKLALYISCLFAVSVVVLMLIAVAKQLDQVILVKYILQLVALYAGILIELSLLYLLYSFLEKTSYNSSLLISKATVISMGITIFIYAVYTFIVLLADSIAVTQVRAIQLAAIVSPMKTYVNFALLIFLTYFSYEYQKSKHNKLLSVACVTILLSETLAVFIGQICSGITCLLLPEMMADEGYVISNILSSVKLAVQDISNLANIVGFSFIIIALIKDEAIRKAESAVIISFVVLGGIEIFLRTQVGYMEVNIYHALAEIAILLYLCILTVRIGRGKTYCTNI